MKKSLMIFLGIATLCIGGIFFVDKVVNANINAEPNMIITAKQQDIKVYEENTFEIKLKIDTGKIEHNSNYPNGFKLNKNYLTLKEKSKFELVGATIKGIEPINQYIPQPMKELKVEGNSINLGEFEYPWNGVNCKKENKEVTLKIKALKAGVYNDINKNSIKDSIELSYENIDGTTIPKQLSGAINVVVDRLKYTKGSLLAGEKPVDNIKVGQYFDLNYKINPGTLEKAINERVNGDFEKLPYGNERRLIYVIDKAAIDNVGANNEIAKDSIKKSLEVLKQEKPEIKTSLVVYGENAEIIKVNDKEIYSIDELIQCVDKIESKEISGNLGDGIRKAKYLANSNVEVDSSIVLVTDSNPNYYTQKSDKNKDLAIERENKKGVSIEDKNIAQDYVNDIVNEIVIEENDKTRWYGVNYGIKDEQLLTNELIDKLNGVMANVSNPYYDDFAVINKKATEKIVIPGVLEVSSKNSAVEINPLDAKQKIELAFDEIKSEDPKQDPTFIANPQEIPINIKVKLTRLDTINLASNEVVDIKFTVNHGGQIHEMNFDGSGEDWEVAGNAPYIRTGFFNGKLKINSKGIDISKPEGVYALADQVLEAVDYADLAIENHFGFGAIINPIEDNITVAPKIIKNKIVTEIPRKGELDKEYPGPAYKVYRYEPERESFIPIEARTINYEVGKIYLLTIDCYINKDLLGTEFEIGIDIDPELATDGNKINDFRGLNVTVVDKPEHF